METRVTNNLQVFDGAGALPADHPLKWLLKPHLRLVWNRDAVLRTAVAKTNDGEIGHENGT